MNPLLSVLIKFYWDMPMLFCLHVVYGYVYTMTAKWCGYNTSKSQIAHKTKSIFCLTLYRKYLLRLFLE